MAGLEIGVVPSGVDDRCVDVGELSLRYLRKGSGPALVYLHDSLGNIGWLPLFEDLASTFDVVVPDLPGFGGSQCPLWARSTRDIAILVAQLFARLDLDDVTLVGIGFGGWIAAEIATMDPRLVRRLVLIGAAGIKPRTGEIADQMLRGAALRPRRLSRCDVVSTACSPSTKKRSTTSPTRSISCGICPPR